MMLRSELLRDDKIHFGMMRALSSEMSSRSQAICEPQSREQDVVAMNTACLEERCQKLTCDATAMPHAVACRGQDAGQTNCGLGSFNSQPL